MAGVTPPASLAIFDSESDYRGILAAAAQDHSRVAVQHLHPPEELHPGACWIEPALLSFLNNKGNLGQLVDPDHTPRRTVVPLEDLASVHPSPSHPIVLKAATDFSTGAGAAVAIARSPEDVERARSRFQGGTAVVIEEFLPIERNLCLCYASDGDSTEYHGYSQQLTSEQGVYQGGVFEPNVPAPREAVAAGFRVMQEAVRRGYRGFAGFDMAVLADGRLVVMDLNFRLCASTAALLWYGTLKARAVKGVHARFCVLRGQGSSDAVFALARRAVEANILFPLAVYDPVLSPYPDAYPIIRALILGGDQHVVEDHRRMLANSGLAS